MKVPMTICALCFLMTTTVHGDNFSATHNFDINAFHESLFNSYEQGMDDPLPQLKELAFPTEASPTVKAHHAHHNADMRKTISKEAESMMRSVPHSAYEEVQSVEPLSKAEEQALEASIIKKLGRQFKGEALVPYHTLMYWQGSHLYVHFTDISELQSLDRFLHDHPQAAARTHVVVGHSKYSQHDYDKLLYNFDTFYSKKSAGADIISATPIIGRLALTVEVERAYPYIMDSVKQAFGNRISVTVKSK